MVFSRAQSIEYADSMRMSTLRAAPRDLIRKKDFSRTFSERNTCLSIVPSASSNRAEHKTVQTRHEKTRTKKTKKHARSSSTYRVRLANATVGVLLAFELYPRRHSRRIHAKLLGDVLDALVLVVAVVVDDLLLELLRVQILAALKKKEGGNGNAV